MAFVNLSLLLGGLLTAIPIVLHLVMRQRPKHLVFPALQFLRERRETNRRKLQLRHWVLLALRCAAVVLLALAFARPSVVSALASKWLVVGLVGLALLLVAGIEAAAVIQQRGRAIVAALGGLALILGFVFAALLFGASNEGDGFSLGDQDAPVAAALVFDTSPTMDYRFRNSTRLEESQDIGSWLLSQLPANSEVAVVDSRPGPAVFSVDLAAASKSVERLRTTGVPTPLADVIARGLDLVTQSQQQRKELYVFTDLTATSWRDTDGALARRLAEDSDTLVYVVDVGVVDPTNAALGDLTLSAQTLVSSNELRVATDIATIGQAGTRVVELYIEQPDVQLPIVVDGETKMPTPLPRGREEVVFESPGSQRVEFRVRGLERGVHQGYVAIAGDDGLPSDNRRYFAVEVQPAWPVLVVAPDNVNSSLFTEAIAPFAFRQSGQARFECTVIRQADLANRQLDTFASVCLLNPQPLTTTLWEQLGRYVRRGGGLAICLGHNAQPTTAFNEPAARLLTGGRLARIWRSAEPDLFLAPQRYDHPILRLFRDRPTSVPWQASPIYRHWVIDELGDNSAAVTSFGNNKPALIETSHGRGRVVTMTTPASEPAQPSGRVAWNELATSEDGWPFLIIANEMMLYLCGQDETRLNYVTGDTAVLRNDAERDPDRYQLFAPGEDPREVVVRGDQLSVRFTEQPGAYRLKGHRGEPIVRGFAVNLARQATDLTRIDEPQLDRHLGEGRFQLARDRDEIVLEVGEARVGREFYPHLLLFLAVVLAVEQLMSNRFYRHHD